MAVTFRSVGISPGANSTTCVIVKPVGLTVGDLMIAHVIAKIYGTAVTPPAGWTEIRQDAYTSDIRSALFWKIAVQGDVDATNFTFTTGNSLNLGAITAWYGHDPTTPINANNGQANAKSATVTAPTITPSVANCVICLFCSGDGTRTFSAYAIATSNPPSWSERYDQSYTDLCQALGSAARPETTATGNGTATISTEEENIGQLVAIAPVTGTTVTPSTLTLTITTYAPTLITSDNKIITPSTLALSLTTFVPTLIYGTVVTPSTIGLSITGYAPIIVIPITITPITLALTLTFYAPTLDATNKAPKKRRCILFRKVKTCMKYCPYKRECLRKISM